MNVIGARNPTPNQSRPDATSQGGEVSKAKTGADSGLGSAARSSLDTAPRQVSVIQPVEESVKVSFTPREAPALEEGEEAGVTYAKPSIARIDKSSESNKPETLAQSASSSSGAQDASQTSVSQNSVSQNSVSITSQPVSQSLSNQEGPQQTSSKENPSSTGQASAEQASNEQPSTQPTRQNLTEQELEQIQTLKQRDQEVRQHEQAHAIVGGATTGAPKYEYQKGPDGKRYAVEGEVSVRFSSSPDPETGIENATIIKRAAYAPAEPSAQDRAVVQEAQQRINNAKQELMKESLQGG